MARARNRRSTGGNSHRPGARRGNPGLSTKLAWLGGGLAGGLILGYAGYYLGAQTHSRDATTPPVAAVAPAAPKPAPAAPKPAAPAAAQTPPRFDFYTLLPEMEVEISDEKLNEALQALPRTADQGPYVLQLGSFRRHDEADGLKARLALIGIEASVQKVIIREDDVWYRVRIGPYDSLRDVSQLRNRLNRNNISHVLIRLGA